MNNANASERRQKIREQMKDYYGDPAASREKKQNNDSRRSGEVPELDLDSEYFNVGKYTTNLLRSESLKGLVERDTELLRSIRKLDSELQELVYRNYSKFISATDTIREMKDNVSEMDTKLQALSSNVDNIGQLSREIGEKVHSHRKKIAEAISTNRMLKKVQFLVTLPSTMKKLINKGEYTAGVKYWVAGDGFLARHSEISSISKIQVECTVLAKELYHKLEESMCTVPLEEPEAMDRVRSIVESMRLIRATSLFANESGKDSSGFHFEESIMLSLMKNVTSNFEMGIQAAQKSFKASLSIPDYRSMDMQKRVEYVNQVNVREALAQLKSTCASFAVNTERVHSIVNIVDSSSVSVRVAQAVEPALVEIVASTAQSLSDFLSASVVSICEDGFCIMNDPTAYKSNIQETLTSLMKQIKQVAQTFKSLGPLYLDSTGKKPNKTYPASVDSEMSKIIKNLTTTFDDSLHTQPTDELITQLGVPKGHSEDILQPYRAQIAFTVSRLAYASASAVANETFHSILVESEVLGKNDLALAQKELTSIGRELYNGAVVLFAQISLQATSSTCFGIDSKIAMSDPSQQTVEGIELSLKPLYQIWEQVYRLLQSLPPVLSISSPPKRGRMENPLRTNLQAGRPLARPRPGEAEVGNRGGIKYLRGDSYDLQSSVEQIFSRESPLVRTKPRDGHPARFVECIVIYSLKGLVNYVREVSSFPSVAFQRIQITCEILLRNLLSPSEGTLEKEWLALWDDQASNSIHQLLNELCTCVYERCGEKKAISNDTLNKIIPNRNVVTSQSNPFTKTAEVTPSTTVPQTIPSNASANIQGKQNEKSPFRETTQTQKSSEAPKPTVHMQTQGDKYVTKRTSVADSNARHANDDEELPLE